MDVAANLAIAVGAVGNASGRIFSGWLSDTIGRLQTLRLMVGVSVLAFLALPHISGAAMLYGMVFVVYYCYGTQLSVYASTTGDFFGTKNLGVNYGLLFTAWGVAGVIGPIIAGRLFDIFGNYTNAFYVGSGICVLALGSLLMAKRPEVPADGRHGGGQGSEGGLRPGTSVHHQRVGRLPVAGPRRVRCRRGGSSLPWEANPSMLSVWKPRRR